LLLVRDWTVDVVLDSVGVVWVIDTEDGQAARTATASERRAALFQSLRRYPEMLSMMPDSPPDAETCTMCQGTGVPEISLTKPSLRNLVCECAGAGWIARDLSSP
jgi:hypothetical protein